MNNTVISLKNRDIREFEKTININPKFYRLQRVTAQTGFNHATFRVHRPEPNLMLYGYAPIQWGYSVRRIDETTEQPSAFPANNTDVIYQKPFSVTNSMTQITMSINGYGFHYPNIGIWGKYLHQVFSTKEQMKYKFSTCGGTFPTYQGAFDEQFTVGDLDDKEDEGIKWAENSAFDHYKTSIGVLAPLAGLFRVNSLEPLMVGLFNPYENKHTLPKWSWYKQNSWMIPHVEHMTLDIVLNEMAVNTFVYPYARMNNIGDDIFLESQAETQNLTGELILTWVSPDIGYQIPREVKLNSWNLRHFVRPLNDGLPIDDEEIISFDTGILQLQQVPTSLLVFATNTIEDTECFAISQDTDGAGGNQTTNFNRSSLEMNPEISDLTVSIEVNNKVVDTRFTTRQLYRITENNCNEIPWQYTAYIGGTQRYADTPGNMFLYLRPQDLNIHTSTGTLVTNFTFQLEGTLTAHQAFSFDLDTFPAPGLIQETYNLHVVAFFNNYFVKLNIEGEVTANYVVHAI